VTSSISGIDSFLDVVRAEIRPGGVVILNIKVDPAP